MDVTYRQCSIEEFEAVFREDHPDKPLWCDYGQARRASHRLGAEVDGKIRGAIAFDDSYSEQIEDTEQWTTSYLDFQYVSRDYRGKGIGRGLLTRAIEFLVAAGRTPIGGAISSARMEKLFEKLPLELRQHLKTSLTPLYAEGIDVWADHDL